MSPRSVANGADGNLLAKAFGVERAVGQRHSTLIFSTEYQEHPEGGGAGILPGEHASDVIGEQRNRRKTREP